MPLDEPQPLGEAEQAFLLGLYLSEDLKRMGFCFGSPLIRATGSFTRDELSLAVFYGLPTSNDPEGPYVNPSAVTFTTTVTGEQVDVAVTGIRRYIGVYPGESVASLFLDVGLSTYGEEYFCIVDGQLLRSDHMPATAQIGSIGRDRYRLKPWTDEPAFADEDWYLRVVALVAFNKEGRAEAALIQRLPSRPDQVISIPPP